jgi:hypothetical protein
METGFCRPVKFINPSRFLRRALDALSRCGRLWEMGVPATEKAFGSA